MRVLALPGPLFLFPWVPRPFPCPHQTPALQQQPLRLQPRPPALCRVQPAAEGHEEESWGRQRCEKPPRCGNACGEHMAIITPRGGSDHVGFQPPDRVPHLARTQPGLCAAAGLSLQPSQQQPPAPSPSPCPLTGRDPRLSWWLWLCAAVVLRGCFWDGLSLPRPDPAGHSPASAPAWLRDGGTATWARCLCIASGSQFPPGFPWLIPHHAHVWGTSPRAPEPPGAGGATALSPPCCSSATRCHGAPRSLVEAAEQLLAGDRAGSSSQTL